LGDGHRMQWPLAAIEALGAAHVRRADETSVERIGPRVIRALDVRIEMSGRLLADARAPMPADIVKRARRAALIPRDDHALGADRAHHVVARASDVARPAGAEPPPVKDPVEL